MTDITIPPEALEAAEKAILKEWTDMNSGADAARAACLAMLKAWPGVERIYRSEDEKLFTIILPLNTENTDV